MAIAATAAIALVGCAQGEAGGGGGGGGGGGQGNGNNGGDITLTFAYTVDSAHPAAVCAAEPFSSAVEEASGGAITVEQFPGGQLGTEAELVDSLLNGDVDLAFPNSGGLAQYYAPLSVLSAAFLFDDLESMLEISRGDIGQELWSGLEEATGVQVIDLWPLGTREVTTSGVAATTPEDLNGVQMRAPDAPIWIANVEALGAVPTPMALEELYTGLQQGVVQAQENPVVLIESQGFDEVQDHLIMTHHVVQGAPFLAGEDTWAQLSDEQKEIVSTAAADAADELVGCLNEQTAEILAEWEADGSMTIVEDIDREAFRENAAEILLPQFGDDWAGFYEKIRAAQDAA